MRPILDPRRVLLLALPFVACQVYDKSLQEGYSGGKLGGQGGSNSGGSSANGGAAGTVTGPGSSFGGSQTMGGGGNGAASGSGGNGSGAAGTGGNVGGGAGADPTGGTGGSTTGTGGTGGSAGTGGVVDPGPQLLIDDLEDRNGSLERPAYTGVWFTSSDPIGTGTLAPMAGSAFAPAQVSPARGTSMWAAQISGVWDGWGALLGFSFMAVPPTPAGAKAPPFDATEYAGIIFYAKVGAGITDVPRIEFLTPATEPSAEHYGLALDMLTTSWQPVTVLFDELLPPDWATGNPVWTPDEIRTVQFKFEADQPFDLWVDDVMFVEP